MILSFKDLARLIKVFLSYRTLQMVRFSFHCNRCDIHNFDNDMLVTQIGYFGHHLEKALKHHNRGNRGLAKRNRVEKLLLEYKKRQNADPKIADWCERLLYHYDHNPEIYINRISGNETNGENLYLLEFLRRRTTVRFWQNKEVNIKIVKDIVNTAHVSSPLSCNRQTIRVFMKRNKSQDIGDSNNKSLFSKAPVALYVAHDDRLFSDFYETALDVGSFCSIVMIAAKAYGLEGCWIYDNELMKNKKFRKEISLPQHYRIYSTITLGYPLDRQEKPPRLSNILEQIND